MADELEVDPNEICERGVVTVKDVRAMRKSYYAEGTVSAEEADALFAINTSCPNATPEWGDLFVEAITDYVVHQAEPAGYVTVENADWLLERISVEGRVQSMTELELLVHVIEQARWAPEKLVRYALEQVKHAVIGGTGPLRVSDMLEPGVVTAREVALIRRILYAFGGDRNIGISRTEAEVLLEINDATDPARNDPAWADLFVKAVANHLMAASGYAVPSRDEALREAEWLEEREGIEGFLGNMLRGGLAGVWQSYRSQDAEAVALERIERQRIAIVTAEAISEPEAKWLADRLGRKSPMSEPEKALLRFIKDQSPRIDPALLPLLDRAG